MKLSDYLTSQGHGAVHAMATAIGAHAPDVSDWRNSRRSVPIERCVQIEQFTDGAVSRRDLRPGDWWHIWPELVDDEHPVPPRPMSGPARHLRRDRRVVGDGPVRGVAREAGQQEPRKLLRTAERMRTGRGNFD